MTINPPLSENDVGKRVRLREGVCTIVTAAWSVRGGVRVSTGYETFNDSSGFSELESKYDIVERLDPVDHIADPGKKVEQQPDPQMGEIWKHKDLMMKVLVITRVDRDVYYVHRSGTMACRSIESFSKDWHLLFRNAVNWEDV